MTYSPKNQYNLYQRANENSSNLGHVIMLYDGAINFLRKAVEAIREENWEVRWNMIGKTSAIINGLRECLDFEQGKETAQTLNDFYASIDWRLVSVQHNNRIDICEAVIEELSGMRDAWKDVAKQIASASAIPTVPASAADAVSTDNSSSGTQVVA